jgi:hypothetical protein
MQVDSTAGNDDCFQWCYEAVQIPRTTVGTTAAPLRNKRTTSCRSGTRSLEVAMRPSVALVLLLTSHVPENRYVNGASFDAISMKPAFF